MDELKSPFHKISHREEKVGRFLITQDQVEVRGHQQNYDFICMKPGVCILPIIDGKFVLLRQFRYPINTWQWEFPGGFIDDQEKPKEAAIRELEEETGYKAKEIIELGSFFPSFGSTNEKIYIFVIECEVGGQLDLEPGEVSKVFLKEVAEVEEMILSNEFQHGAGLVAWSKYKVFLKDK